MNNMNERDDFLSYMSDAKKSDAVVKMDFTLFASRVPDNIAIFACEGKADKIIYYYWIKRLGMDLEYENYISGTKSNTLKLFDALQRDVTGVGQRVYYFVDNDFDGLQGRPLSERIFATCRYSIENYIVCPEVLDDILRVEFHCDGLPHVRNDIVKKFDALYIKFLREMKDINFRIYLSRVLPIRQCVDITSKINLIANITIDDVNIIASPEEIVQLEREPLQEEIEAQSACFESLEPVLHYRGKFALAFFTRWLELARKDRQAAGSIIFSMIEKPLYAINGNFGLENLATKSILPPGLGKFLEHVSENKAIHNAI